MNERNEDGNMKNRYLCILLMLTLIMSIVLTSCKKENKIDINIKKPVTLTFYTFLEDGKEAEAYKEIINEFEKEHDNINIKLVADANGYNQKIKTALESGKAPDIIGLQRKDMLQYAKQGYLKDLTSFVDSNNIKDKYYGVSLGYGKFENKYYGIGDLPKTVEWFYNVDMFEKAGLSEPKNLDDLINVCNKLKNKTKTPIVLGAKDAWTINTLLGLITVQNVSTDELIKAYTNDDKAAFQNLKGMNESIDIIDQLLKSGAISRRCDDYNYADSVDAFVNGKAAILPGGTWTIDKIEKMKPNGFKYKAFEYPVKFKEGGNSDYCATAIHVVTVNAKTKREKQVMEFMEFLSSDKAQEIFAEKNGISGLKSVNKESENEVENQVIKHLDSTNGNSIMYVDNVSNKMSEVTQERIQKMISSRKVEPSEVWDLIVEQSFLK